jgi:hypothetical protein
VRSSKAELVDKLRALAGAGPVGLAKLASATGRSLRTLQRLADRDPAFRELLTPLLLRNRGDVAPATVADDGVQRRLDARLVERIAAAEERGHQLEIQKGQSEQDLITALRQLKDCNLLIDHLRSGKDRDLLVDHLYSRIAEFEAERGKLSKRDVPVTPLKVIPGGKK